jgi:hypothetical protein
MWMLAKSRTSCGIAKQMDCRFCLSRQEVLWCATHPYGLERFVLSLCLSAELWCVVWCGQAWLQGLRDGAPGQADPVLPAASAPRHQNQTDLALGPAQQEGAQDSIPAGFRLACDTNTVPRMQVKQRLAYATDPHNSEVFKLIRY